MEKKEKKIALIGGLTFTGLKAYKEYLDNKEEKKEEEKEPKKKKDLPPLKRDIFGYCPGCSTEICGDPCSKENNFNLPF